MASPKEGEQDFSGIREACSHLIIPFVCGGEELKKYTIKCPYVKEQTWEYNSARHKTLEMNFTIIPVEVGSLVGSFTVFYYPGENVEIARFDVAPTHRGRGAGKNAFGKLLWIFEEGPLKNLCKFWYFKLAINHKSFSNDTPDIARHIYTSFGFERFFPKFSGCDQKEIFEHYKKYRKPPDL